MISNKCYYALKAMLELAKQEGSGPITIAEIAGRQGIPVRFLEAILRELKQGGLTDSHRGKDGGYFLAREAQAIRMGEVIRLFEGRALIDDPDSRGEDAGSVRSVFTPVWEEAQQALAAIFDRVDFRELAGQDNDLARKDAQNYAI